ncbi:MAG: S-layer homology domain-containing protein [Bacillota bacterium]|nr:S-layer homology domain-containing protein [Bacillota bacterium]
MRRTVKSILCLVLAIVMLASMGAIAFADNEKSSSYDYEKYMCIGDSIAAGCALTKDGSETYFDQNSENYAYVYSEAYIYLGHNYAVVPKAYHTLVADALGAELLQCARSGMRGVELRYWLEGVFNDYDETCSWDNTYFDVDANGFTLEDLDAFNAYINYPEKIKEADVISINIGSNDVFSFTFGVVLKQLTADTSDPTLNEIKAYFESTGNLGVAFGKLVDTYQSMGKIADLLSVLLDTLNTTYNQYEENYNAIMEKIYELNPDAVVINVGVFNPLRYVRFNSENDTDISFIANGIVNKMNNLLKNYQSKYNNCHYADVTETETYYQSYDDPLFWQYFTLKVHPTIAGHQYMAQQILNVIPKTLPFEDVKAGDWCFDDVLYCYENGLMKGVTETAFDPNATMTRGMVATVLYRMAGSPDVSGMSHPFKDLAAGRYCTDAVIWAYNTGVIQGYSDNTFKPDQLITREQLTTMIYRYACLNGYADPADKNSLALLKFVDRGSVSEFAKPAMRWAVANGIVNGKTAVKLVPQGDATRAQCATMLARFDRLIKAE